MKTRRVNKLENRLAAIKQYEEQKAMKKVHTKIYCSKRLNDKEIKYLESTSDSICTRDLQ